MTNIYIHLPQAADSANAWKDYGVPFSTAIIGALLAYIPSRLLARRASVELLERDKKSRHDSDVTAARKVYIKLHVLVNTITSYHDQIENMIKKAEDDGNSHMAIAQRISAFVGVDREQTIAFSAEELEFLIAAKRIDYVDDLILLARKHGAMLANLAAFAAMKTEAHYEFARHGSTSRDKNLVSKTVAELPAHLANYFQVKADELNHYAVQMRAMISDAANFARDIASKYEEITEQYLGKESSVGLA